MATVNPECTHVSASSLSSLKACATRYRLAYREGLRPALDTEAQRVGTSWHGIQEVYRDAVNEWTPSDPGEAEHPADYMQAYGLAKVIEFLNDRYSQLPDWADPAAKELERIVLLTCFQGYLWYYSNDEVDTLATELKFTLPLKNRIGLPLPATEAVKVGMIDRLIFWQGMIGNTEYKSTTRAISGDQGQEFWDAFRKNDQISMYAIAMREMYKRGELPLSDSIKECIQTGEYRFGNTMLDAFRRPTIRPSALSQSETKTLIETGKYYDQDFIVTVSDARVEETGEVDAKGKAKVQHTATVVVNETAAVVEPGAKGFAIRETIEMFAARLLHDITETPDKYFVRRELVRTDAELKAAEAGFFNAYQTAKFMEKSGCWTENGAACRATFKCQYIPICFGPGADAVCDGKTEVAGFKRIFVDLTVNGQTVEEEA